MNYILFFISLILLFTSCSKHTPPTTKKKMPVKPSVERKAPIVIKREVIGLIPEYIIQRAERKYNKFSRKRYEAYNAKLYQLNNRSVDDRLDGINDFFNRVPYGDDIPTWGEKDYWSTPLEFLGKDRGDCEDYVIAKYFALISLGIPKEKLYFSRVNSTKFERAHMVLSYYTTPSSIPLILDNTNLKIFPADKRNDLTLVYNLNGETLSYTKEAGYINNVKVFKKWDTLLNNIDKNKL